MVNNLDPRILVEGQIKTRAGARDRVKITNGPVYDLSIAQQLIKSHGFIPLNTDSKSAPKRELDPKLKDDEIKEIILALRHPDHYQDSEISTTTANMKVDSDEYLIWWNRNRKAEDTTKNFGIPIYVKFGFKYPNKRCLIVTIHRSDRH